MFRPRSRVVAAAAACALSLTGLAVAPTTGAATTTEPEPGPGESGGWTNWKGDAGRTGVADAGPTGEPVQVWRVQADGPCNPSPVVEEGVVYAPCGGTLYALDAATGAERWRFE